VILTDRLEPHVDLSIVVSTFNRASDLSRFVESVMQMKDSRGRLWELIVVDNNSSDETRLVMSKAVAACPNHVYYFFEPRQGKSFGLNTGLAAVRGQVVAFTDDDAIVPADWAAAILDFFDTHPSAACVGGRVDLYNANDAPTSTRTSPSAFQVDKKHFSAENIPIIGCNMAFRVDLIRDVGEFDTDIGPGSKFGVAEDLDYLYRIVRCNNLIYYEPRIRLLHNHGRRGVLDLKRLEFNYITGRGAFYCKYGLMGDRLAWRMAWWEARKYFGWRKLFALFEPSAREDLWRLKLLVRGALRYLFLGKSKAPKNTLVKQAGQSTS
jgi:glycosyltransferase involved in cell wall biosynthesis